MAVYDLWGYLPPNIIRSLSNVIPNRCGHDREFKPSINFYTEYLKVLKALKINPGVNTCEGLRKIDYVRISEAEMAVQKASKEARTTKRQIKRKHDALEQSMQDEYSAGNF
ncbi:hypothetical protein TNCV_4211011 [Trichonephila clavipes]|nr:hypothetical protein TNCV_4211011 [Trichonephila clavipes]